VKIVKSLEHQRRFFFVDRHEREIRNRQAIFSWYHHPPPDGIDQLTDSAREPVRLRLDDLTRRLRRHQPREMKKQLQNQITRREIVHV